MSEFLTFADLVPQEDLEFRIEALRSGVARLENEASSLYPRLETLLRKYEAIAREVSRTKQEQAELSRIRESENPQKVRRVLAATADRIEDTAQADSPLAAMGGVLRRLLVSQEIGPYLPDLN
ncbi:hypothetical protein HY214_02525 [Candidatus Roizmanbacteria bacterium]|nr:hypothetical protein [Candidatus Roizmanbacteria bacterium]